MSRAATENVAVAPDGTGVTLVAAGVVMVRLWSSACTRWTWVLLADCPAPSVTVTVNEQVCSASVKLAGAVQVVFRSAAFPKLPPGSEPEHPAFHA